ncbi:hypothetical protein RclHR1_05450005 [Rhizophagus clarus]|uniref:Uncharacterized protein n=1 Tax=Rhizophagus clarus TaxID=94130 RepID=A0A2Z6RZT6_9GLOM|nr:hypothetical protein RclHR1_05450005 [Rhizophagus clarus]
MNNLIFLLSFILFSIYIYVIECLFFFRSKGGTLKETKAARRDSNYFITVLKTLSERFNRSATSILDNSTQYTLGGTVILIGIQQICKKAQLMIVEKKNFFIH